MVNLVDSALEFWLTSGRYSDQFEKELAQFLDIKHVSFCNSGSSANLLAFAALTSSQLGERAIRAGDEVITVAAAFPTTVSPILQYGAVPVFVDMTIPQYNIDVSQLERALSKKTKAIMIAHTLGNPFDLIAVKAFCDQHQLWLVEDNCDALGSKVLFDGKMRYTGTIGDIGTSSFYPPHHMTTGEGGAVYTNNTKLHRIIQSMRDWGRDCYCPSGVDNRCGHRFDRTFGELPKGYDHKYVYSHFGYNLKATDLQAAIGCAQLEKLTSFIEARKFNWNHLRTSLEDLKDVLVLPEALEGSEPSWFGFLMSVKKSEKYNAADLTDFLESKNIQTRRLFAGNLIKHPCFDEIRDEESKYRVVGDLKFTDKIMGDALWVGVYPGMGDAKLNYIADMIHCYFNNNQCKHYN